MGTQIKRDITRELEKFFALCQIINVIVASRIWWSNAIKRFIKSDACRGLIIDKSHLLHSHM